MEFHPGIHRVNALWCPPNYLWSRPFMLLASTCDGKTDDSARMSLWARILARTSPQTIGK
jgi:hypothetical protein